MRRIGFALGILLLLAVGLALAKYWHDQIPKRHYKRSLDLMYRNRAVIEIWYRENGRYPGSPNGWQTLSQLRGSLGALGSSLATVDGWGNEFVYRPSLDGDHFWLVSPGGDGRVQFRVGTHAHVQREVAADLVLIDGRFAQVWEGWTQCPEGVKNLPDAYLACAARGEPGCAGRLPKPCSEYDLPVAR